MPTAVDDWPFVGRRAQLTRIDGLLNAARPRSAGIVLSGPPGIGKTRLLADVRSTARRRGAYPLALAGTGATRRVPFGVLAQLPREIPVPTGERRGLADAADRLTAAVGRQRLVVTLDDAHLVDDATNALLHLLVLRRDAFLVASVRRAETLPDALGRLWRDGSMAWLKLDPLTEADVAELIGAVLGGPVDSAAAKVLAQLSGGNPLYLRELVQGALEQGRLGEHDGLWRLSHPPALPSPLVDLLGRRLGRLPESVRDTIDVIGRTEPVELALLGQVVGDMAMEDAERLGFVQLTTEGRRRYVRLSHPLYAELLRQRPGTLRVHRLRCDLADALAGTGLRRAGDAVRLGLQHLDGLTRPTAEVLLRAARQAASVHDHALMIRLADAAQQAGAGFPASHAVAEGLAWSGAFEPAEQAFARLEPDASTDQERAIAARDRAGNLFFGLGRTGDASRVVGTALDAIQDPQWRAELRLLQAGITICCGHAQAAVADGALTPVDPHNQRLWLHRLPGAVSTLTALGRTAEAIALGEQSLDPLARSAAAYPYLASPTQVTLSEAYLLHGQLDRARHHAETGRRDAIAACADGLRGQWALGIGRVAVVEGRLQEAELMFREGIVLLRDHLTLLGRPGLLQCLGGLAMVQALAGDGAAAQETLDRAGQWAIEEYIVPVLTLARAWLLAGAGELHQAADLVLRFAEVVGAAGSDGHAAALWHAAALFGAAGQAATELTALATRHPGPLRELLAQHAVGLSTGDAERLLDAADRFDALGARFYAAAAASDALPHLSGAAAERARSHVDSCEAGPRLARIRTASHPVPSGLTRREREIAQLAAAGLTNAAIAARLTLSVRTIEAHLGRVYAKLGVPGRRDLVGVLRPGGR
jgi:ATP/maltotriose-dependent transcriptional regulator MalT